MRYLDHPVQRVLSIMPPLYDDIWTAAKGMYKLEPVVAEGGEVVIYAPHIDEISYTHGRVLDEVGYHVRDYFLKQWDRFKDYPAGVLAHSTHLRGIGEYDVITETERPRVSVTLATGIPEERCRRLGLGYIDPATINMAAWAADEGTLVVPKAGGDFVSAEGNAKRCFVLGEAALRPTPAPAPKSARPPAPPPPTTPLPATTRPCACRATAPTPQPARPRWRRWPCSASTPWRAGREPARSAAESPRRWQIQSPIAPRPIPTTAATSPTLSTGSSA